MREQLCGQDVGDCGSVVVFSVGKTIYTTLSAPHPINDAKSIRKLCDALLRAAEIIDDGLENE